MTTNRSVQDKSGDFALPDIRGSACIRDEKSAPYCPRASARKPLIMHCAVIVGGCAQGVSDLRGGHWHCKHLKDNRLQSFTGIK